MEQRIREGILDSRNQSASKRERKFLRKTARLSLLIIAFAILIVIATGRPRLAHQQLFSSLPKYNQHEWPMKLKSDERESIYLNPAPAALPTSSFQRSFDLRGVQEHLTTIRQDWKIVVNNFMDDTDVSRYSARKIREHFHTDINSVQSTCILVTIRDGNVTFSQKFDDKRHSRTSSLKYILQKIVKEKGKSLAGATFMVMMSDGHRPLVPTFGSARHWKTWKMMIPVPLGNSRGGKAEWGTPFQGWDSYIDRTIVATHGNYSWNYKSEKAVFRGSLSMQKYILGSCNEENSGHCERAKRWNQVNRGVLYEICKEEPDLFDIGFTQHKRKADGPAEQLENAPAIVTPMKFHDFQNYKYVLNVGNNQDWAERLRSLLFMNSVVVIHQAETQEFFTPLLKPWVHFIPTNLHMTDLIENIKWARENDQFARQLVRNQNAFADRYITERSMQQYWEVALEEFSVRQAKAAAVGVGSEH